MHVFKLTRIFNVLHEFQKYNSFAVVLISRLQNLRLIANGKTLPMMLVTRPEILTISKPRGICKNSAISI